MLWLICFCVLNISYTATCDLNHWPLPRFSTLMFSVCPTVDSVCQFSDTMTNTWENHLIKNQIIKWEGLLGLMISETLAPVISGYIALWDSMSWRNHVTEQKSSCHDQEPNEGRERGQRAGEWVLATCPFGDSQEFNYSTCVNSLEGIWLD